MTMASDYFRIRGDYINAIKCLQRAIYYAPRYFVKFNSKQHNCLTIFIFPLLNRNFRNIPTLSLSNMLHKLNFINDSLSIALSTLSFDSNNSLLYYYIGNIYVVYILH